MTKEIRKVLSLIFRIQDSGFKIQDSRFSAEIRRFFAADLSVRYLNSSRIGVLSLLFLTISSAACVNQSLLKNNKNVAVVVENNLSEFEKDLETMKTANFDYIFAFRRKDASAFDTDDKKFLRANTPPETNRFVLTDEERAFIAGSRFPFTPENLAALRGRFVVEDYSKPESERQPIDQNANTNQKTTANQNINSGQNTKANR